MLVIVGAVGRLVRLLVVSPGGEMGLFGGSNGKATG